MCVVKCAVNSCIGCVVKCVVKSCRLCKVSVVTLPHSLRLDCIWNLKITQENISKRQVSKE